ncbi:hypothetical protein HY768_11230 [candidate division TA06 bacterium]|uniref:Uncharacterized protein n=1 Tax=candidate division TA06 bacterium TaxID=2250710 RepID=A0A933IBJ7_UNCT6|nr:hypothetical protein [candidate division TA06 bacterium]
MADIPIVMAAIDPCLSCTDRMAIVTGVKRGLRAGDGLGDIKAAWN